jgi:uncharacterized protein
MKRLFVIFGLIWCVSASADETIPPAPAHHFNDYASVVTAATASRLDTLLENYERQSSDQIVVAIFPKMQSDAPIKDYTLRIANSWKVGQKGKNNGVSLFLFVQEHKMYMQVGTGFEKVLSDATCKQILDTKITPHLKQGDFDGGLSEGVMAIITATKGAYQGNDSTAKQSQNATTNASVQNAAIP